ncbi:MAG: type III pantothenate kinase [Bacilli bacterium]|nr:type III pantothenate kinase [Bacilli bacterium]
MLICVDVGNSNINFGLFKEDELVCTFKFSCAEITSIKKMYDNFILALNEYGLLLYDMEFAMISSANENFSNILKEFCKKINVECYFVDYNSPLGLENKFYYKEDLGPDLFIECYEASKKYPLPLFVVDLGTTSNIILVNENREIEGGITYGGLLSAYKASKINSTSFLRFSPISDPNIIGKRISECLQSGILYGSVYAINNMISLIREEKHYEYMNVVISGGLAQYVYQYIDGAIYYENLLLEGLKDIYQDIGKKLYLRTKDNRMISND